ncbi:MAG: CHASE domain-containing protein [Proteobacteria bacterium]|nr:CHASE domain-containing protein [Pseudomonadota bacterium]
MITAIAALYMKSSVERIAERDFTFQCNEIQNKITERLDDHARILQSGAALFKVSEMVTREKWHIFTQHQKFEKQLPGIQGIGFSLLVPREDLTRHVQEIRREGFPEYKLKPDGNREVYSSIIYLEPFSGRNLRAFGYDMFSEPVRRSAMERARDTDMAALSGKVTLVQEAGAEVQAGTLMYFPVYRKGMPIETVEQRRAAIYGWIYSPYRMNDLMQGILGARNPEKEKQLYLQVFDGAQPSPQSLLYESHPAGAKKLRPEERFTRQIPVDFNGQHWTLRFTQTGGGLFAAAYISVWLTILGGMLITLLLSALIRTLLNTRAEAQRIAENLTEELRESEEKYRVIFNNEIYAICIFDLETLALLDVNDAFSRLYGYGREELISGMTIHDITAEHKVSDAATRQAVREGTIFIPLRYHRKKDGTVFPVEIVGGPYSWMGRKVMFALAHDITERKRMEDALLNSKQQYDNLVSNVPVGVYIMRSTPIGAFAFEYVSPRVAEIFNVSAENFLADPQAGFQPIHPDDLDALVKLNQERFRQPQPFNWEGRAIVNGAVKWLSIASSPELLENGDVLWHGVIADITEDKRTEEALRENEARAKAMFQAIPDLMFRMDSQGVFLDYKADISDLYAQSEPTLVGKRNRDITPPEFADLIDRKIRATLETGRLQSFEYQLPILDRGMRYYEARMVASGAAEVTAIVRDITEHKRTEEELLRTQKLESLGILAGGIAHDFNNLMTVVLGNVQLAMMGLPSNHTSYPLLQAVLQSAEQTRDLTSRLITFSKGGFPIKQISDVSGVLQEVVRKMVRKTGVRAAFDIEKDLWSAKVDENQIRQVFYNLTMNAVEAMPEGGTLTIQAQNTKVHSSDGLPLKEGSHLRITFADNGTGIAEENLVLIFDPYFTTKGMGNQKGMGLGLSVCYSVLKKHDGHIAVTSRPGEGTAFTLYLPALAEKAHAAKIERVAPPSSSPNRVLLMEDEIHVRALERAFLERLGYEVTETGDGREAIDCYKEALLLNNPFDLVILDLTVRQGLGGQLTMERLLKEDPSVKAIIASGYVDEPVIEHYKDYGFRGALKKPFSFEEFGEMVKKVIGTEP